MEEFTEKQKQQKAELMEEANKLGRKLTIKATIRLFAMITVIIVANQMFVQSTLFVVLMAFVSAMFNGHMVKQDIEEGNEYLRQKSEEILNNP